ncbi:succinyl-diaminopimelate desuccinylase [Gluconacetobacter diazotrophicus]|uniref:Succinyl-diaminopimelate desuccinylase n=2 Tax=Gluconacetobacter diazotrophicus TaxID=33996 RepID=DAPE_GLUDA|nr:succinyl-diaminopimelate desuccinylase [Gluconacetobacter diazotrophicus]A9HKR2.1 RecName: Full=Succinyl-diaminopimelate desuccinylase; Short=SDAP desuccinylase; AltName: Full=N-succinyl-LL-2,6-diaminoheptanedioate amidohydrolase [Gluconacetobacter diazotrophicus PA1 5]MBB2154934.1 succinyl-diaminopimelate desuccinylase [Gluconacetobacter diazotrophicus]CAP56074.1 putative succinyl-diaminopimelate desuccinylase [Gluconacetobacter diazotrophicus PA1 5]
MTGALTPASTPALTLARDLIRAPSVTPDDGGAIGVLTAALRGLGFDVTDLPFGEGPARTPNLFARLGRSGPHLCFAGHTDVVPPGDGGWTSGPFEAALRDGCLYGRGACDMKGGIAAFVGAVARILESGRTLRGSVSLLITGDEEGPATFGTVKVLEWMAAHGQVPDFCVVGEPTNPDHLGDVIKIGRRGSLNARIVVPGIQGHVAYPHRADNPVHRLLAILSDLTARPLDQGTEWFEPSSLQVTTVDVGNEATNVIPGRATARLNIRFNDLHTGQGLADWIRGVAHVHAPGAEVTVQISGEAFRTEPTPELDMLAASIQAVTGRAPRLDTGGGTSDARFISRYCPVAEFGLVGASMHKVDEHVPVADLLALTDIYAAFLERLMG